MGILKSICGFFRVCGPGCPIYYGMLARDRNSLLGCAKCEFYDGRMGSPAYISPANSITITKRKGCSLTVSQIEDILDSRSRLTDGVADGQEDRS